jgi:hypothetical protein
MDSVTVVSGLSGTSRPSNNPKGAFIAYERQVWFGVAPDADPDQSRP